MIMKNRQILKRVIYNSLMLLSIGTGYVAETNTGVDIPQVKLRSWPTKIIDDYAPTDHIQQLGDNEEEYFGFTPILGNYVGLSQNDLNLKELADKNMNYPSMIISKEDLSLDCSYSLDDTFSVPKVTIRDEFNSGIFDIDSSVVMVSGGIINAWGEISYPNDEDQDFQQLIVLQDKAAANQEIYNASWSKFSKDVAYHSAKYIGQKAWENAGYYGRLIGAWHINHLAVDTLEELTANVSWGVANLAGGPAVGAGAYYTTKGVLKTLRFVLPGFEGYLAGVYVPITKTLIVDPLLNYGPSFATEVAKTAYSAVKSPCS